MTDRTHRIAEIIMAHIYTWTDGKTETSHIKFGTAALRSAVNMIDDSITISEFNAVLADLVQRKHLKKIGAYIYGLGTGKGLKRYPVNDKSLLIPQHNPGFNNSKNKNQLKHQPEHKPDEQPQSEQETKTVTQQDTIKDDYSVPAGRTYVTPPAFVETKNDKAQRIAKEVSELRHRLNGRFENIDFKATTLANLADALSQTSPDLAETLLEIKSDLQGEAL